MSVMRELVAREEPVKMVSFSGKASVPQGVRLERADLMDKDQVKESMKGSKVVFQCAQPPYQKWGEMFIPLEDNIISGAIAAGAKLVAAENMYMLTKLHQDGTLQVAMGRGADFFGPNVNHSSVGSRLFNPIMKGKACTVMGNPDRKHTYTFIDDFGKALVVLSQHDDAFGQAWHVPNANTVTTREFVELAYRIAGFSAAIRTMGKGMLRLGGLFIPEAKESIEMLYQFEEDFIVESNKFSKRFGVVATPLEHALEKTLLSLKIDSSAGIL